MRKKIFYGMAVLMVAALMSGCGKVPQAEIDMANAAVDSAREAGADMYVPDAFSALQDSMQSVMILVEGQGSKMLKNYGEAREKLALVTTQAGEVINRSDARKEELKAGILVTIADTRKLLEENKTLITKAPKGKEGTAALQAIKNEIAVIEISVTEAQTMLVNGELLACQAKAGAAKEKAASIHAELTEVIAKYNKAKK